MPISYTAMQVYQQYLTTYGNKRSSRYDTHDSKELRRLYSSIQRKNRFAPLYLTEPSSDEITYAINLKEQAKALHETIDALSGDNEDQLFSTKTAYSSNPDLVSVTYEQLSDGHSSYYNNVPQSFTMSIESFATPQCNTSSYLSSDQPVLMPAGSYSFDLITNKLHYELQFNLQEGDTHKQLQLRLMRLINHSDLGVHARVLQDNGRSALQITSDALGTPLQEKQHFRITDENTSHTEGMVHYLGLNKSVEKAGNASYTVDGEQYSSYDNTFKVYDAYELTLHPDAALDYSGETIEIGLYPNPQSLAHNIKDFVQSYNRFIDCTRTPAQKSNRLNNDMHKLLALHKNGIEKYGIQVTSDNTLNFPAAPDIEQTSPPDTKELQSFGSHLLKKLNSISLDPMEYLSRGICAYSNPATSYINPYVTSIYSGMLFNTYC